jgi:hypothetical protein
MTSDLKPPLFPMDRADPFDPPAAYDALRSEGVRAALRDPRLSIVKTMGPRPRSPSAGGQG